MLETLERRTLLAMMVWNTNSGNYDVAANWTNAADSSDHHIPTSSEDAQINTTGITVTHSSGTDSVNSLADAGAFALSGGTLNVTTTMSVSGTFALSGGTLQYATVSSGTGITSAGGTLSGVTLDADLTLASGNAFRDTAIVNGLALNGTITVNTRAILDFVGNETLSTGEAGGVAVANDGGYRDPGGEEFGAGIHTANNTTLVIHRRLRAEAVQSFEGHQPHRVEPGATGRGGRAGNEWGDATAGQGAGPSSQWRHHSRRQRSRSSFERWCRRRNSHDRHRNYLLRNSRRKIRFEPRQRCGWHDFPRVQTPPRGRPWGRFRCVI